MGNRVIGRGAVADADQHSRFLRGQIFGVFSKVIQTGSFNTVAAVPVEIRVAVKLYDIGFGVFLFQFGSSRISTILRVKVRSWVRYVFLITCWVMVLPP